jgi:pyrimidine deaminase RibD-like protein
MSDDDRKFMEMAVQQARNQAERFGLSASAGRADPDPLVGCVIVTKTGLVAAGYRGEIEPHEHAEFTVMERKMSNGVLAGATVYTTLEPCTDRNPPKKSCADWLIERHVSRVVIGIMDPDRKGNGYHKLIQARIVVELFPQDSKDLVEEILELNRRFIESRSKVSLGLGRFPQNQIVNQIPETFSTVSAHLVRLNVPRAEAFVNARLFDINPDRKCIGSIISINALRGVTGIPAEMIAVVERNDRLSIPSYVHQEMASTRVGGRDGNKAALIQWLQDSLDVDRGNITLEIAPAKYSMKIAMWNVRAKLIDDLKEGNLEVLDELTQGDQGQTPKLPCLLHCDGIVITGDNKVILAQRSSSVDMEKTQWGASFGEGVEWDTDRDDSGAVHPIKTIWRGMDQELGLPERWVTDRCGLTTNITFLEIGFQIENLIYSHFSMVELPNLGIEEALERARNHSADKETRAFSSMEFSVEACVSAIVSGYVNGKKLTFGGRFALHLASLNKFGAKFADELARR